MRTVLEFIGGVVVAFTFIAMFIAATLLLSYSFGWVVGWFMTFFFTPPVILGLTFEQLVAFTFTASSIFSYPHIFLRMEEKKRDVASVIKDTTDMAVKKTKEYRGY